MYMYMIMYMHLVMYIEVYVCRSIHSRVIQLMGLGSTFSTVAESRLIDVFCVHGVLWLQLSYLGSFLSALLESR